MIFTLIRFCYFYKVEVITFIFIFFAGNSPFTCKDCNVVFGGKAVFKKHLRSAAHKACSAIDGTAKKYTCDYCALSFHTVRRMKQHSLEVHLCNPTLRCRICNFKTSKRSDLIQHKKSNHPSKIDQRLFMCEICGNSFRSMSNLKEHFIFVHSDERGFKCSVCDKSFKKKSCLVRHNRCHSTERPYKCHHCGASYKQLFHLVRHQTSAHSGEKSNKPKRMIDSNQSSNISSEKQRLEEQIQSTQNEGASGHELNNDKDLIFTTSDAAVLNDQAASSSDTTQLFTVIDSQLIQLIPDGTVTLVGNEIQTMSIASLASEETFHTTDTLTMKTDNETDVLTAEEINSSLDIGKLDDSKASLQLQNIVGDSSSLQFANSFEILPFDPVHFLNNK